MHISCGVASLDDLAGPRHGAISRLQHVSASVMRCGLELEIDGVHFRGLPFQQGWDRPRHIRHHDLRKPGTTRPSQDGSLESRAEG